MDVSEFRTFQQDTPDSERWELIAGVPVQVPPQTILHARMVTDMANALDAPLRASGRSLMALQRVAIDFSADLGLGGRCVPSPDVVVIDAYHEPDAWLAPRAYLVGEIVGDPHDLRPVGRGTWLEAKIACYMAHEPCGAIVIIDQGCRDIVLHQRGDDGWTLRNLGDGEDLIVPRLGIRIPAVSLHGRQPLKGRGDEPDISAMAWTILRLWEGRPYARLNAVGDVALPFAKSFNLSVISEINELARRGLLVIPNGLVLTEAGRALVGHEIADQTDETANPAGPSVR